MVSASKEDYLRAIYLLEEQKGEIRSVDIAEYLNISKPSVSEMMRRLTIDGLIVSERYSPIAFTSKGRKLAEGLTSKHRIIESFLKTFLHLKGVKIHEEAHRLEHAFSDESISKLKKMLGNPKVDPHGKKIP